MTGRGRWSADWWLSCGICGGQWWIEGGLKRPVAIAKDKGWELTRAWGYICPDCAKTFTSGNKQ